MNPAEFISFLKDTLGLCAHHSGDGAIHFVFIDWRHVGKLLAAGAVVFDDFKNMCVWVKSNVGQGSFYRSQHELVLVFKHGRGAHLNTFGLGAGGRTRSNVWRYASVNRVARTNLCQTGKCVLPLSSLPISRCRSPSTYETLWG